MVKLIIVTTGLPGSGKGTFAKVAEQLKIPVIVMGDIVRSEVVRRGLDLTPENIRRVALQLREEEGSIAVAKRVAEKIRGLESCAVVIDGVRSLDEVEVFRKLGKVVIISIEAPFEVRLGRVLKRGRVDDVSEEELRKRDELEISLGIDKVMRNAEIVIENVSTLQDFVDKSKRLLSELLRTYCY
ncbi:hypothetical protein EYM_03040 [Ignicoccus islandicus DSM 13165]|uniref:Dephospho-CoA kinase n=1 Tax=Ignicoccus islandicus DSM 13165 TaxID=940295 RepID=A0A0U3DVX9_9CREN|nr:AAA family ATPase [Ignicoccus islandicus]ALU11610.1 hypothetical protein EYM_03040 [Ignicoccus islandicus DSM 13165]